MQTITLKKGLDIPIKGKPDSTIREGNKVFKAALVGDDYVGMKPTMIVQEGDSVVCGQPLFHEKKDDNIVFTAPAAGVVAAINRGAKRKFESLVIELDGDEAISFCEQDTDPNELAADEIRRIFLQSGLWTLFRTRPYGKIPGSATNPHSLFITAMDTTPLAPDCVKIIEHYSTLYARGLQVLSRLLDCPLHYCTAPRTLHNCEKMEDAQANITYHSFAGPHPAGLASTHMHFIDPVHENKTVWQIGYQGVIAIGGLFATGKLFTEQIVALSGSGMKNPSLIKTRVGACIDDITAGELDSTVEHIRVLSGSVLSGRQAISPWNFIGRFHDQIAAIEDSSGRAYFNWLIPGLQRFSSKPIFASFWSGRKKDIPMNTALWGGRRAIYPLGSYEDVMPLDIIATSLIKALVLGDTEKSKNLGCLELIEEDLGLCGFVCPGKNEFGPALRDVLSAIERGD